ASKLEIRKLLVTGSKYVRSKTIHFFHGKLPRGDRFLQDRARSDGTFQPEMGRNAAYGSRVRRQDNARHDTGRRYAPDDVRLAGRSADDRKYLARDRPGRQRRGKRVFR